ncbi:MAG: dienelactone hydrolase family protein [Candidatus Rokubacteria bacterium]|nr:dienelactone hydrolase family protein [Candidatus Rokubacteria bacterium]
MRVTLIAALLPATLLAGCAGGVSFSNLTPGRPLTITGELYRPEGPGPFPAMVLLHGCGGVEALHGRWARWLIERGYVALVVDSWTPRGIVENCSKDTPDPERTERFDDAFGALRYLQSRPFVDPHRIGAMGWSNGGVFAMAVINGPSLDRARKRGVMLPPVGFRLGVGIYPGGCFSLVEELVVAPLLVLIGEADDWTPARICAEMVNAMRAKGAEARITIYPGAYHYFDNVDYPLQVLPDVENRYKPGGCCGATVSHQPGAAAAAFAEVEAFLAGHLGFFSAPRSPRR